MDEWDIDEIIAEADAAKELNKSKDSAAPDNSTVGVFQEIEYGTENLSFVAVVEHKYLIGLLQRRVLPLLYEACLAEKGNLTSTEIAEALGVSVAKVSHSLGRLAENGLVVKRNSSYRLTRPGIKLINNGKVVFRGAGAKCSKYISSH